MLDDFIDSEVSHSEATATYLLSEICSDDWSHSRSYSFNLYDLELNKLNNTVALTDLFTDQPWGNQIFSLDELERRLKLLVKAS
jgi:hypothetical protein